MLALIGPVCPDVTLYLKTVVENQPDALNLVHRFCLVYDPRASRAVSLLIYVRSTHRRRDVCHASLIVF